MRHLPIALTAAMVVALAGCAPDYSPNTYATNAVQQANKVESAVVIGFRQVKITASGTVGAVSGGAAGGVLGAQADASGISSALGAVGGTVVGGLVGTTIEHVAGDTTGWEYIVRKSNGDLLSVTQREPSPIPLGQKVLVITGNQARIVPDYSLALDPTPAPSQGAEKTGAAEKTGVKETPAASPAPVAAAHQTPPSPPSEAAVPAAVTPAAAAAPVALAPDKPTPPAKSEEAAAPPDAAPTAPAAASDSETAPKAPQP